MHATLDLKPGRWQPRHPMEDRRAGSVPSVVQSDYSSQLLIPIWLRQSFSVCRSFDTRPAYSFQRAAPARRGIRRADRGRVGGVGDKRRERKKEKRESGKPGVGQLISSTHTEESSPYSRSENITSPRWDASRERPHPASVQIVWNTMTERTTTCTRKMTGTGICSWTQPGRNSRERWARPTDRPTDWLTSPCLRCGSGGFMLPSAPLLVTIRRGNVVATQQCGHISSSGWLKVGNSLIMGLLKKKRKKKRHLRDLINWASSPKLFSLFLEN